jgi:putative transposase
VLTDGRGVPLGAVIEGVSCNDHKLMRQTLQAIPVNLPKPRRRHPQHLCLDKVFDHDEPRALSQQFGFTRHRRTCSEEAKAKRWVVAPTHSWLSRFAPP